MQRFFFLSKIFSFIFMNILSLNLFKIVILSVNLICWIRNTKCYAFNVMTNGSVHIMLHWNDKMVAFHSFITMKANFLLNETIIFIEQEICFLNVPQSCTLNQTSSDNAKQVLSSWSLSYKGDIPSGYVPHNCT